MTNEKIDEILGNAGNVHGSELRTRVIEALKRTARIPIGGNYLNMTLNNRIAGVSAGSWYEEMNDEQLLEKIVSPETTFEEFTPEEGAAMPSATYLKANIPGKNGILNIEDLPKDSPLYLTILHNGTDRLSVATTAEVESKDENETTIILSNEEEYGEVMSTLHPGLPVRPSDLTWDKFREKNEKIDSLINQRINEEKGKNPERDLRRNPIKLILQITAEQAHSIGFDMAKLSSEEVKKELAENAIDVTKVGSISLGDIANAIDDHNKAQEH